MVENSDYQIPEMFKGKTFLDPTYGPAFRAFFDSEDALISFLNGALELEGDRQINHLTYRSEEPIDVRTPEPSLYVFDIRATTINGTCMDIEMQRFSHAHLVDRIFLYNASLLLKAKNELDRAWENEKDERPVAAPNAPLKRKSKRYKHPEIYSIWICNFAVLGQDEFKDHWNVYSENSIKKSAPLNINPKNKYIIYNLEKFQKAPDELKTAEDYWFYWLKHAAENSDLPPQNSTIESALERIRIATDNQTLMQEQEKCMQIIYDYEDSIAEAEQIAEARGLEKGSIEKACEMAKAMLANGLSISMASNISGLTIEELKNL